MCTLPADDSDGTQNVLRVCECAGSVCSAAWGWGRSGRRGFEQPEVREEAALGRDGILSSTAKTRVNGRRSEACRDTIGEALAHPNAGKFSEARVSLSPFRYCLLAASRAVWKVRID